jgi:hypothetical protein
MLVFLLVMLLPAAMLVFLGVRLLEQDRAPAKGRPRFWSMPPIPPYGCASRKLPL